MSEQEQHVNEDGELVDGPMPDDDPDQTEGVEDEAPPTDPEPEPEPEQPSDEDRAKLAKALDTRFTNYRNSVEKILADEVADWLLCPLCVSGMAPGYVNRHDLGRVPEEIQANVQMYLGYARETEYPHARGVTECDVCTGLGKVSTGSRVAEHMTITCPTCKGYGYTPPPGFSTNAAPTNGDAIHAVTEALADIETPERDNWGEPKVLPDGTLNSNYGKQPQFKSVHPVYGVTANLSPEELVSG